MTQTGVSSGCRGGAPADPFVPTSARTLLPALVGNQRVRRLRNLGGVPYIALRTLGGAREASQLLRLLLTCPPRPDGVMIAGHRGGVACRRSWSASADGQDLSAAEARSLESLGRLEPGSLVLADPRRYESFAVIPLAACDR
jgi:hypothetical protein